MTRTSLLCCALLTSLAAPASALGATAATDRACYPADGSSVVTITGSGFAPDAEVLLQSGGGVIGVASSDSSGNVRTTIPVPAPPDSGPSKYDQATEIKLVQGDVSATTSFRSAQTVADFGPSAGSPTKLKVRFSAYGFGVATATAQPMPSVYVHYVDPKGKLRRTIALGAGAAPCGTIKRSSLRKLFPFDPRRGTWTLQFDTSRKYRRATGVSRFVFDKIQLTVS